MIEINAARTMCRHDNLLSSLRTLYYSILANGNGSKAYVPVEDSADTMFILASPATLAGLESVTRGCNVDADGPIRFNGIRCVSTTNVPDDELRIECGQTVLGRLVNIS